jgi:predicted nucleotidyltransferase
MHTLKRKNFTLDSSRVYAAMKDKGFGTIDSLAVELGVHRNTILPYLVGDRALPDCLDRLLKLLDLTPAEAITRNTRTKQQYALNIAGLVSSLVKQAPDGAFVLFGSRAKGTYRKHSDYDIGIFKTKGMPFNELSSLIDITESWEADKPYDVNLTNLEIADAGFLKEISKDWVFLGGDLLAWVYLQMRAEIELYE